MLNAIKGAQHRKTLEKINQELLRNMNEDDPRSTLARGGLPSPNSTESKDRNNLLLGLWRGDPQWKRLGLFPTQSSAKHESSALHTVKGEMISCLQASNLNNHV